MTKELFVEIIELYQKQNELVDKYSELISYDSPIIEFGWKMFDIVLQEAFSESQLDWIYWWLYDRISFITGEELPYYDGDNNKFCVNTPEDLWELVKTYRLDYAEEEDCDTKFDIA